MEPTKPALRPKYEHGPYVEITDQGVTIGEDGNIVWLSHGEWNELVRLIRTRQLRAVTT